MNLLKNLVFVQPGTKLTIHTIFAIRSDKIEEKSKEFCTKVEESSTFLSNICYARIQAKVYEEAGWMQGIVKCVKIRATPVARNTKVYGEWRALIERDAYSNVVVVPLRLH